MDQWREFETWQEKCSGWMKDMEARLRDIDLRPTLADKQTQLEKLKVGYQCICSMVCSCICTLLTLLSQLTDTSGKAKVCTENMLL